MRRPLWCLKLSSSDRCGSAPCGTPALAHGSAPCTWAVESRSWGKSGAGFLGHCGWGRHLCGRARSAGVDRTTRPGGHTARIVSLAQLRGKRGCSDRPQCRRERPHQTAMHQSAYDAHVAVGRRSHSTFGWTPRPLHIRGSAAPPSCAWGGRGCGTTPHRSASRTWDSRWEHHRRNNDPCRDARRPV